MTRRDRLMATLQGKPIDRPPVCFYEIDGMDENPSDPDPFNIYSDPSWLPLIQLARDKTDRIPMRGVPFRDAPPNPAAPFTKNETFVRNGSRFTIQTITIGGRTLTRRTRRDPDVNTVWTEEHLLKDVDDVKAYLQLPVAPFGGTPDVSSVLDAESRLGDTGIILIDIGDPICAAASMFDMSDYMVIALTEPDLFRRLLDRFAASIHPKTEAVAKALPGRLWRVVGPEYASPPYLPPRLFQEYVVEYDRPMVDTIQRHGGYARIHSHGRLKDILDLIVSMNPAGLDPIEPPTQGDVQLRYVRERYGKDMVLFGNIEASDIENLPPDQFAEKVRRALDEGTSGSGRGFVLMPSACPYGRKLSALSLRNYETMVELVNRL